MGAKELTKHEYLKKKLEFAKLDAKVQKYEEQNRIEFWKPWPHQQKALDMLGMGLKLPEKKKRILALMWANRTGKTELGASVVVSAGEDENPWKDGGKPLFAGQGQLKIRILCADWDDHAKGVIVPKLKQVARYGSYETRKNGQGVEANWFFKKTKKTIELITVKQDTMQHEGWNGHIVWGDEPFPKDKYVANLRGLMDYEGVFLVTGTSIAEPWMYDDIILSTDPLIGSMTNIPITANPNLTKEAIDNFKASMTDEEWEARGMGGLMHLTGLVLKGFDKDTHVLTEPFKIPPTWPVSVQIDIALNKKQAVSFFAADDRGGDYIIDEIWDNISPEEIGYEIIRRKKDNNWKLRDVYIDPLAKGDSAYMRNRAGVVDDTFTVIDNIIRKEGMMLHVASKDKESGIRAIQTALVGVNKMPALYIFPHCEGHIYQFMRWIYDDLGKPMKKDDDFPENTYRYYLQPHRRRAGLISKPVPRPVIIDSKVGC